MVVVLCIFGEVGRVDYDIGGSEAVGDGVAAGDRFTLFGLGPGGPRGVAAIGHKLFLAHSHECCLLLK